MNENPFGANGFWLSIGFMSAIFTMISCYYLNSTGMIIFGYMMAYSAHKQLQYVRNGRKSWWYTDE